ncbi:sodium:proton antiporter [Candidatus Xianfuyuplasma coldseepsis]|uniref:Cation:proton antiporter subunit C n=1 Tax=Candidatus Xianfuyuplasma coldseepsis TaxID=2782163 RepID=A0A7L7KRT3_9MOLU|nr:cation:proton antiporter subunit C [Xianfuyuplasma coldseepsis]QMS84664.1 cation:proton antiporter subunit C [Xianfuyuplasma coldseepsis]
MNPILTFVVVLVGFYGLSTSKNIIKSIFSVTIIESGIILLFLNIGNLNGGTIPIITDTTTTIVDPLPQALMITTIVIGSTVTALALMLSIKVFHQYGTLDWAIVLRRKDGE